MLVAFGLFLLSVVIISSGTVDGRTIDVPDEFPTIQQAIDNATDGDTVRIGTGVFDAADGQAVNASITVDKPIDIVGNGTARTTVTGGPVSVFSIRSPDVNLFALSIVGNGTQVGVSVIGSDGCEIEDVHVSNCRVNLFIEDSDHVVIGSSEFSGTECSVLLTNGTDWCTFTDLVARDSGIGIAVSDEDVRNPCRWNSFEGCTLTRNEIGLDIREKGINVVIKYCTFLNNFDTSLRISGEWHIVKDCSFGESGKKGIVLQSARFSSFDNMSFDSEVYDGIELWSSADNVFSNCTFAGSRYPVSLIGSSNNRFSRLDVKLCSRGVDVREYSYNTVVQDSTFYRAGECIYIGANHTTVRNCTFERSTLAVYIYRWFVDVEDCHIDNMRSDGIRIIPGGWTLIRNCTINGVYDDGIYVNDYRELDEPLTVEDCHIENTGGRGIYIGYRGGVIIRRNDVSNVGMYAIEGYDVDNMTVLHNHVTDCRYGIFVSGGGNHTIGGNTVSGAEMDGLTIYSTSYGRSNRIHNNTLTGNGMGRDTGSAIHIGSNIIHIGSNNTVEHNLLVDNQNGILLSGQRCSNNIIRWNTIRGSLVHGVLVKDWGGPNEYYQNWFLENNNHVLDTNPEDRFDDGRYGNYWDDYRDRYPEAELAGAVWDTPYEVRAGYEVFDRYPLAYMYEANPPTARAGPDGIAPQGIPFTFDGSGSTDDSAIDTYKWTFKTGNGILVVMVSGSPRVTFTFDDIGTIDVTLTVTDVWGSTGTDSMTLTVADGTPPVAVAGDDLWVDVGTAFYLDASSSRDNVGIVLYRWTVASGGLDLHVLGKRPKLVIDVPGNYTVVLVVEDAAGNRGSDTMDLEVGDTTPPVADAGPDVTIDQGGMAPFDGTGSHDDHGIITWRWEFTIDGKDLLATGPTSEYYFRRAGSYVVTLTVEDSGKNRDTDTMTVHVRDTEPPQAVPGGGVVVPQGTVVELNGSGSTDNVGVVRYEWGLLYGGNDLTYSGPLIDFLFSEVGEYEVTLTVHDASGNQDTASVNITVLDSARPSAVAILARDVDAGTRVMMDGGMSTDNVGVESYTWTFTHDGRYQRLQGAQVYFNFTVPGEYRIKLEVIDAAGNSDVDEEVLSVHPVITEGGDEGTGLWVILVVLLVVASLVFAVIKYLGRDGT